MAGQRVLTTARGTRAVVATPWYLLGAVSAANCLIAYEPKGAASAAAALVNKAKSGTYDASNGTAYPSWAAGSGWTFTGSSSEYLSIGGGTGPTLDGACSLLFRITPGGAGSNRILAGNASSGGVNCGMGSANKGIFRVSTTVILTATTAFTTEKVLGFTYSADGVCIAYLNGNSDGTNTDDRAVSADLDAVGRHATLYYTGVMAAMAVYDVVLTPTQIGLITTAMLAI